MGVWKNIPKHTFDRDCEYLKEGHCFYCCDLCNYDRHLCHFCGENLNHNSYAYRDGKKVRHWLSDCRPDLVEHEEGPACTWSYLLDPDWIPSLRREGKDAIADSDEGRPTCYAYQDFDTQQWGTEHKHFHRDGPMV